MSHPTYPRLFEQGRIGGMVTKNRLVQSSLCDNMSDRNGAVTDQKIAYFRRKAEGGVGWINLGYAYVVPRGRGCTYYMVGIQDDELIPGLRRLTDAVHEHDVRMGCQLAHAGRQTTHHYIHDMTAEAPSPVPEPVLGEVPGELSGERIKEIVREFAQAAVRAKTAGFDLVEFHGAHGYLHHSFVSPMTNRRTDEYGGSIENRLRFSRESVRAVRDAVGSDFPVGYRLSGQDYFEGGITLEDSLATVAMLEDSWGQPSPSKQPFRQTRALQPPSGSPTCDHGNIRLTRFEPPYTEPYVRWCGGTGSARARTYPIKVARRPVGGSFRARHHSVTKLPGCSANLKEPDT